MTASKHKLFFLRGLVREAGHWSGFLERFAAAFPECEAIPLDLPGNGARFREKSPLTVAEMTAALREKFLILRGSKNHLFALSLGAMVGLEWLQRWPDDFRSAVLLNTSLRGLSPFYHRLRPCNYPRILKMLLSRNPDFVERNILEMTSNKQNKNIELAKEWARISLARPVSPSNAFRQLVAAARYCPPREKPSVPILLLNGGGDRLVNPACSQAIAYHWGSEQVTLKVHPTAGHDLTLDEPEWVIEAVRRFMPKDHFGG